MSWRDDYRQGSFRAVAFRTAEHELSGGRRAPIFEYPDRDDPSSEDLGRRARQYRLELFVGGGDYFAERDALIDALETKGPGKLIHPFLGEQQVQVLDYSVSETTEEGGIARFSVLFSEAGVEVAQSQAADANAQAILSADAAIAKAPADFASRFSIAKLPEFVQNAASDVVGGIGDVTKLIAAGSGGLGDALASFNEAAGFLEDVSSLLGRPLDLGGSLAGLTQSVISLSASSSPMQAIQAANRLLDISVDRPIYMTAARTAQAENADAITHLVRVVSSAELVRTVAETEFSSREAALSVRDAAIGRLDDLALAAADAGEDERAADYDGLRRALAADIAQRVPALPYLQDYQPRATEPALVIANRLYGHSQAEAMAAEIMAGSIGNPAFVAGGRTLKVLVDG